MDRPRTFKEFLDEGLERSGRAADAVRARHEQKPFESREEIRAAFQNELELLERCQFTEQDRAADQAAWNISL